MKRWMDVLVVEIRQIIDNWTNVKADASAILMDWIGRRIHKFPLCIHWEKGQKRERENGRARESECESQGMCGYTL